MELTELEEYRIKRMRKGFTIAYLSKQLNISQGMLSLYERGLVNMNRDKIEKYKSFIDEN